MTSAGHIGRVGAAAIMAMLPLAAAAQALSFRESGGLRHVCGGVGSEERRELEALRQPGQLEILFASARRGAYLAGVEVELAPARPGAAPVRFRAEGPTCLVEAPAGAWRLTARHGSEQRTRELTLGPKGNRVVLTFPDEPWDGIRASDEEKRQARQP